MKNGIKGSCHCGEIEIEITGRISGLKHCHCQSCRKLHGTAYASNAIVDADDFKIIKGKDNFHDYRTHANKVARFCKTCCSPIYAYNPMHPKAVYIRMGVLEFDEDPEIRAEYHWWVSEKAPWYEICDNLPQFASLPNEDDLERLRSL
ncbi:MAG: GFA family protein [Verrucomicrobiota bacterium]